MIVAVPADPVEHVRDRIAEHVAAELTSDAAVITSTVSDRPFFPVMIRGLDGPELTLLTDRPSIEAFYAARVATFEILDTTRVAELRTDWYALHESVATIRHVGPYQGVAPTGRTHRVHSVVLFPVDVDGIVGELEWTSVDFARIFAGQPDVDDGSDRPSVDDEAHIPHRRLARASLHEQLLDAWLAGRASEATSLLGPGAIWASEHVHEHPPFGSRWSTDSHTVSQIVGAVEPGVVRASRPLQRYASNWFSFAERVVDLDRDDRCPIRVASLLAFDGDRAVGHLAYSVDAYSVDVQPTSERRSR